MRFDSDHEAAKASLVTASVLLQSQTERSPGANGSKPGVLTNWQKLKFGPFELSVGERLLLRDGRRLPLGDRAFDILTYLAKRSGEVVAKQELMDQVWSDVTVGEGSLRVQVAAIRKVLGDGQFGNRFIANIKGRGYAFVSTVVQLEGGKGSGSNSPDFRSGLVARPLMPISRAGGNIMPGRALGSDSEVIRRSPKLVQRK